MGHDEPDRISDADAGLLLIRLKVAAVFVSHGMEKQIGAVVASGASSDPDPDPDPDADEAIALAAVTAVIVSRSARSTS